MVTRQYKNTDERVSLLGFGTMRLPLVGSDPADIDFELAQSMVDRAIASGVNYFDTAYGYHNRHSELFVGKALKKYPRSSFFLATKMPIWHVKEAADTKKIFDEQLSGCQTDYFDFYLAHNINDGNYDDFVKNGIYDFMVEMKKQGKIRHIGFSFHGSVELLKKVTSSFEWDFAQIQYNYLDCAIAHAAEEYDILEKAGIPCIVMEPVRGGALANLCAEANEVLKSAQPDRSIASWAIRFAASGKNVLTVLSGMSTPEQVADNLATAVNFEPLTEDELATVRRAAEIFRGYFTVPCTKCNYCRENCPNSIDVPEMLRLFGQYRMEKDDEDYKREYLRVGEGQRASDCLSCRLCESRCPQSIGIVKIMDDLKALNSRLGI